MLLAHNANVEAQDNVSDFIGFNNNDFVDCHLILNNVFVLNSYFFIPTPPNCLVWRNSSSCCFQPRSSGNREAFSRAFSGTLS